MTKLEIIEPKGSQFKMTAIVCNSCGAILGTGSYFDAGKLVKDQEEEIKRLKRSVDNIEHIIIQMANNMNRR